MFLNDFSRSAFLTSPKWRLQLLVMNKKKNIQFRYWQFTDFLLDPEPDVEKWLDI